MALALASFLPNWFVRAEIRLWCLVDQEVTVLLEMLFNDVDRQSLMDSGVACVALVADPVRGPLALVWLPRELALVDEALLVLFRVVPCSPNWLLVDVMLRVFEHLLQSGCCVFVDPHVALVKGFLPVLCAFVI